MTISMLPILCLLAGSLAVLLSIVAGILECSRRKYNVSNEVTHISFSNNLDLNPSKLTFNKVCMYVRMYFFVNKAEILSVPSVPT